MSKKKKSNKELIRETLLLQLFIAILQLVALVTTLIKELNS